MSEAIKRNKRKRKKTFLQNARKYAKKGYYGRGSHMDGDTYQYFVRILEVFNQGFESDEDKGAFVNNVFEQTENKEIDCSCNQVGCRVIEMLLPFASHEVLQRFMEKFSEDIRPLTKDRFASFVLQALVRVTCQRFYDENIAEGQRLCCRKFIIKTSKFLLNNLEDYVWDNYGNRVLRTCLCGLMQIPEEDKKNKPNINPVKNEIEVEIKKEIPEEYVDIVKEYGERLIIWPQFNELCNSELTSGLLQVLLRTVKKADSKLLKKYLKKLLNENFLSDKNSEESSEKLPPGFMSTSLLMLLEASLEVAGKKMFVQYCEKLFFGRMVKLATLKSTSFCIQKVFMYCSNKEQFDLLFDELTEHFWEIIEKVHPAVILVVAQTCKRLSSKQGLFVQNMMKCLNCFEPEDRQKHFIICMCRLARFDSNNIPSLENLQKEKLNLQGTLMLQLMLEFNKPIKIVNSILSMDAQDLKNLFSNSMGSHIVDSYVTSKYVGEKSREKLVWKMKGTYQDLATSKYGSRSFEALWNVANMKVKIQIMEELAHREGSWSNSECGKIIASKINLALFKRNKENWKNSFNKVVKPEEVLADVLK